MVASPPPFPFTANNLKTVLVSAINCGVLTIRITIRILMIRIMIRIQNISVTPRSFLVLWCRLSWTVPCVLATADLPSDTVY